jgi:hypothetical protein
MSDEQEQQRREEDAALEREIRRERKFSLQEAIAQLAGPGGMKGASPIARLQQAAVEIENWLRQHLTDAGGALEVIIHRDIQGSELLLNNFNEPLVVLAAYCQRLLTSDYLLKELVRRADSEWAQTMGERPFFEMDGVPNHPDDPYTVESVRRALTGLLDQLHLEHSEGV